MQRAVLATLVVALFLTGCTASEPEVAAKKTSAEADAPRPKAPKLVQANSVDSVLNVGHVKGCLYEDQVTIASVAGQYYGPQDLVAGEIELTREIDFTVPGEVKMVEKPAFADELKQTVTRFTRQRAEGQQVAGMEPRLPALLAQGRTGRYWHRSDRGLLRQQLKGSCRAAGG